MTGALPTGAAPGGTSGSGDEHTRAALLASQHVVQKAEALCERIGAKLMVRQTACCRVRIASLPLRIMMVAVCWLDSVVFVVHN